MKQQDGFLIAVATYLFGRHHKLRWIVSLLPLTLAVYRKVMARQGIRGHRMRPTASA
ncbi:MAG: hypothetical protein SFX73_22480 [Kofleriaceae bacterium]|nr:hypothetical protein [Kofleriaceae bacterium]